LPWFCYNTGGSMTLTRPYAPSRLYEHDNSIADLVRRSGHAQAEGIRRGGDISANMWGSLGQIGSNAVSEYSRQRERQAEQKRMDDAAAAKAEAQRPILAEEAEQRRLNREKTQRELDEFNRKRERETAVSTALTQPGKGKAAILESVKGDPVVFEMVEKAFEKQSQGMRRIFGDAALNARTIGRDTVEGAFAALDSLEEDGINPTMLAPIREEITKDPKSVSGIIDRLLSQHPDEEVRKLVREIKAPGTRQVEITNRDGSKTIEIVPDTPGQKFQSFAPPKEAKAPDYINVDGKPHQLINGQLVPVPIKAQPGASTVSEIPFVNTPQFKSLSAPNQNNAVKAYEFIKAVQNYRDLVETHTSGWGSGMEAAGKEATVLDAAHKKLLTTAAADWGQGALQKPDKEVIEAAIPNVVSWNPLKWAERWGRGGKEGVLGAIDNLLRDTTSKLKGSYGLEPPAGQIGAPPPPAPSPGGAPGANPFQRNRP